MCGKFTAMMTWREYCDLAGTGTDGGSGSGVDAIDPNTVLGLFTPMSRVPVLHLGPVRQRRTTLMRWGWPDDRRGRDASGLFRWLHARAEEIDSTPAWIESFRDGARGVIFTKEFNIGEEMPNGKTKQWICSRKDGLPVAMPVLFTSRDLLQGTLWAFVMVTQEAIEPLHGRDNRMPALLEMDDVAAWIGELGATNAELKAMLLKSYHAELVIREQPTKPKVPRNTTKAKPNPKAPTEPTLF